MVALMTAQDLMTLWLCDFNLVLARKFQSGFNRFRSTTGEINGAILEMIAGKDQQFPRVFFGNGRRELAGVDEFQTRGLFGHCGRDLTDTMADEIHCSRAGEIKIAIAVGVPNVDALSANGCRKLFAEGAAENGRAGLDGGRIVHRRIIALRIPRASPGMSLILSS